MQEFVGFATEALTYNKLYTISDRSLGVGRFEHATVGPVRPTIEGNFLEELAGGGFDSEGELIAACLQPRSEDRNAIQIRQASLTTPHVSSRLDEAVFGGVAFDHFGHFLLETTARLWALEEHRDKPWLFLTSGRPELRSYQRDFLELLGLRRDQIVVVSDWTGVDRLVVPEPAFVYHHWATKAYLDAFRRAETPSGAGRRIFLSRSDTTMALTVGERELEEVLRAEGWVIEIPERLPAPEQAALFRDDNVVMGLQGSAMHLGLFAAPGRRVVHLCRGQAYRGYYILDDLTQAQATYFYAMRSTALPPKAITGPFHLDLEATIKFLRGEELISGSGVAISWFDAGTMTRLDADYEAWWYFTESQTRFHRQLAHDGSFADRQSALEFALKAASLRPDEAKIICHALALTLKLDGPDAASALLDRSLPAGSFGEIDDPQLLYMISLISESRGDMTAAIETASRCVENSPANPTYVNQLATALFRCDRLEESEAALRDLVANGHAAAENLFLLSLIACKRGDVGGATEWAMRAVSTDRWSEPIMIHAADLLTQQDRMDEAIQLHVDFVERCPDNVAILRRLAALQAGRGRMSAARRYLLEAYRHSLSDETLRRQCMDLLRLDGWVPDPGRLGRDPTPAECEQGVMLYMQSRSLRTIGASDDAIKTAIRALELYPGNSTIIEHAIGTIILSRRLVEAHVLSYALIDAGHRGGNVYYLISLIESELGRRDAAQRAAAQAAELEPANDLIREHYERLLVS